VPARSITTGSACHLDAKMVHDALHAFPQWADLDYLFIENVGNLVCPAVYDLGQDVNVVALSITEREDKPVKYPVMFRKADLVLLTKLDLHPYLPRLDLNAVRAGIAQVMPADKVILFSAESGRGVEEWIDWLAERRARTIAAHSEHQQDAAPGGVRGNGHHHHHHHDEHRHA
jgi:hydrogenase nickel incorporation protein HypB